MKYIKLLSIVLLLPTYNLTAQPLITELDKTSYSLGIKTGEHFRTQAIQLNAASFHDGLVTGLNNKKPALTEAEIKILLAKLQEDQMTKHKAQTEILANSNLDQGKEFLAKNKQNKDVITLASGLQYTILASGKGEQAKPNDSVTVNYRGTLIDGTEFDSSYSRNESITFQVNHLIKGWQEALVLMKPGDKWKLFVPAELAYGNQAAGAIIKPNSTLIFELELLAIKGK